MTLPLSFVCASHDFADFDRPVPAPYLRRSFSLAQAPESAELLVTGLGFYRVFVNGAEITKGPLAPYISNPDDLVFYDRYDLSGLLTQGENAIGLLLGNGMQNSFGGYVWEFDKARWRGAPMAALRLTAGLRDGTSFSLETNGSFRTHPSPLLFDDLRCGEVYDARDELPGWCAPGFDDTGWTPALPATPPRGELRLCEAEPIAVSETLAPVSITPYDGGWLYDFGVNTAGRVRLCVRGTPGQRIDLLHAEWYHDGVLEQKNINFADRGDLRSRFVQRSAYICRGEGEETYAPCFAYAGFRYVHVTGITAEQAQPGLLTYEVLHSALPERGGFSCSDETANRLQALTRRSTLANFFYFPTDCPHREKNGWTGDAALSAEHTLLNLGAENSYREWLRNIRAAQNADGAIPGIVPTAGWGFAWGNGPAWDCALTWIPYLVWRYRGDESILRENACAIFRYVSYLTTRVRDDGLIAFGLGDWCPAGRPDAGDYQSPLAFTDSVIAMDIAEKAARIFTVIGWEPQRDFAAAFAARLRAAVRANLVDASTMTAAGACQTSQAMALYFGVFDEEEKPAAFARLLEFIEARDGHFDCGILGLRVLFHVLSAFGEADLAYRMIVRPDFPSYGNWLARGATSLWEDFLPEGGPVNSRNHHFFGDISGWFLSSVAGIVVNPDGTDCRDVEIAPHFVAQLTHAEAFHIAPAGRIAVRWERDGDAVSLVLEAPEAVRGSIRAPQGWTLEDGSAAVPLRAGYFRFVPEKGKENFA